MPGKTKRFWVFGILGLAILAVSLVLGWMHFSRGRLSRVSEQEAVSSPDELAYKSLEAEISAFQERLEILEQDPEFQVAKEQDLKELANRLEEMRRQADRLEFRYGREDRLLDLATQVSSQSADSSYGMVSFLSALFVIVVFGVSLGTSLHFKDLKEELVNLQGEIEDFRARSDQHVREVAQRVQESKNSMEAELENLKSMTARVGKQASAGGIFLDGLVNVHAEAFSQILSTLPLGRILSGTEGHAVRLKGEELKGRLLLLHPELERRKKAVMLLGAVGTKIAKADLRRLQKSVETDKDMALLIESAIRRIDEQLRDK